MIVLVTGASGFVGRNLVAKLAQMEEVECRALVRGELTSPSGNVRVCRISGISETGSIEPFLADVDVLVHTAALVHQPGHLPPSEYHRINTRATLDLARLAAGCGVKRFIFLSTIGVTGRKSRHPVSEESQPAPDTPYAQSKYDAELGLSALSNETGMEVVILRPPMVYGPGCPGNLPRLIRLVRRSPILPFGALSAKRSMISNNNLSSIICLAIEHPAAANKTFVVADADALSVKVLARVIRDVLNVNSLLLPVPAWFLGFLGRILGKATEIESLTQPLVVDTRKITDELGWQPVESACRALQDTIGNA